MADWARTNLTIVADSETLMKIVNQLGYRDPDAKNHLETEQVVFSLWNILRPPTDSLGEYYAPSKSVNGAEHDSPYNWFRWNLENWGTKWDCGNPQRQEILEENMVVYDFDTAWDFPANALMHLSYQYPEASITAVATYSDGGATIASWKDGEQIGITEF